MNSSNFFRNNLLVDINDNHIPEPMFEKDAYIIPMNCFSENNLPRFNTNVDHLEYTNLLNNYLQNITRVEITLRIINNCIDVQKKIMIERNISNNQLFTLIEDNLKVNENINIEKMSLNDSLFVERNDLITSFNNNDILYILINEVVRINCINPLEIINPIEIINPFEDIFNFSNEEGQINNNLNDLMNYLETLVQQDLDDIDIPNNNETLNEEEVDKIATKLYKEIKDDADNNTCSICKTEENFEDNDIIPSLPCNHLFHHNCLKTWLVNYNNNCPLCRVTLSNN